MDADFLDDVQDAFDECVELAGDMFTIGPHEVAGDFDSEGEDLTLTTTGGMQEKYGGTFTVSRRRLPEKPEVLSIITGPHGTRYRIHSVDGDAATWILILTHPNARK